MTSRIRNDTHIRRYGHDAIRQPGPTRPGCTWGLISFLRCDTLRGEDLDTNCVHRPGSGLNGEDRYLVTSPASGLSLTPK